MKQIKRLVENKNALDDCDLTNENHDWMSNLTSIGVWTAKCYPLLLEWMEALMWKQKAEPPLSCLHPDPQKRPCPPSSTESAQLLLKLTLFNSLSGRYDTAEGRLKRWIKSRNFTTAVHSFGPDCILTSAHYSNYCISHHNPPLCFNCKSAKLVHVMSQLSTARAQNADRGQKVKYPVICHFKKCPRIVHTCSNLFNQINNT